MEQRHGPDLYDHPHAHCLQYLPSDSGQESAHSFLQLPGRQRICAFLNIMAPMLLAALAFIFAYRCGLFNIGIAGQMLMSGFMATILVGYNKALPAAVAKPLVIIVGLVVGGLLGAFVGFLKYRFNIHEVVSTIMINYIISFLTGFFINSRYVDSITRSSKICSSAARLTWTKVLIGGYYCNVPLGIVVALIMVFVVKFIFDRTVFGFDLRAVGSNRNAATYAGINVGKSIIMSMMLSGCLAGLAGVTYYLGYTNTIIPKTLAGMGYDAIATALLGNNTPVGAIFASVLITIFQNGANYMSSTLGVAKEIASVITGILLLFSACSGFFRYLSKNKLNRIADEKRAIEKARKLWLSAVSTPRRAVSRTWRSKASRASEPSAERSLPCSSA